MNAYTLIDLLEMRLGEDAERTALMLADRTMTYGQLAEQVEAVASWLHDHGVRRSDRVAIHLHKCFEEVVASFAIWRIGAVAVNVSYQRTPAQLGHIIGNCDAKVLITDRRRYIAAGQAGALTGVDHVLLTGSVGGGGDGAGSVTAWSEIPVDGRAPREPRAVDADLACLHYTSGSTGMPKGVMTTHLNLLDGTRRIDTYLKHRAGDRLLGLVSMSAPWGLLQITSMFAVGGAVVLQPTSLASEIIATIVRQQVTGVAAFPLNWIEILEFLAHTPTELPSLRYITSSGGNIPRVTLEAMPTRLPGVEVHLTYGLTEAFRSTVLPHEEFITKMGSFGKPCPNVDVFVIKDDGICGPGEQGQLIHRGTLVTKGYWNDPQTTAQSFKPCPQLRHLIGDEIVHYSGDLVRIDEDGYLWFVDRIDSLIKCSGHRVSPAEVEHIVHLSGLVTHVVAFGVADGTLGQVVHLAVSREMGEVDVAGLENWCRRNMPTYMVPRRIHVMRGEVPIAGTGKIDRRRIVDRCMLELDQTGGQGGKGQ